MFLEAWLRYSLLSRERLCFDAKSCGLGCVEKWHWKVKDLPSCVSRRGGEDTQQKWIMKGKPGGKVGESYNVSTE